MSSPIERFLERLHTAENRAQREIVLSLTEARALHADITKLLLRLEGSNTENEPAITVEMRGGDF